MALFLFSAIVLGVLLWGMYARHGLVEFELAGGRVGLGMPGEVKSKMPSVHTTVETRVLQWVRALILDGNLGAKCNNREGEERVVD
jgi:hypothetical protein